MKKSINCECALLENIKLHEDIPACVLSSNASLTFRLSRDNRLTKEGVLTLIKFHPLHVVKTKKYYKCFAGLRSYQLAKSQLPLETKVNVVVHSVKNLDVEQQSSIDSLLSSLVFGLDDLAYETDFLNVWRSVERKNRKKIMPGLNNKSNLEILLKCSRRGLSRKSKTLISQLKKELDK